MEEFQYEIKIPKERVAVLIGKKGEVKKRIEEESGIKLEVDSKEGDVIIKGSDALQLYTVREIIRAIGRGFNPDIAFQLFKSDYVLEVISLGEVSKKKEIVQRLKGRVIGAGGKTRRLIEELTEVNISIFGKTVCILGQNDNIYIAKTAIQNLLKGSPHSSVYRWLEKKRHEIRKRAILGNFEK
ncbi:MAG: RNA-processing protein [Nanoarchaeota archaeon]|nr:MAG: RNA-processing protein [Nanoarchaeota archaeon]